MARKAATKQVKARLSTEELAAQSEKVLSAFKVGMFVRKTNASELGVVTEPKITPGGAAEVWVTWGNKSYPEPEQPNLLEQDIEAESSPVQPGNKILIGSGHASCGSIHTVSNLRARGWVSCEDATFHRQYWIAVGDRVSVASWGGQKGVLTSIDPVFVHFDGREKASPISGKDLKGISRIEVESRKSEVESEESDLLPTFDFELSTSEELVCFKESLDEAEQELCSNTESLVFSQEYPGFVANQSNTPDSLTDSESSNLLNQTPTGDRFSAEDMQTSPYTMMSPPSEENQEHTMSLSGAAHAEKFQEQIQIATDLTESNLDFGGKCLESSPSADQNGLSGKTLEQLDTLPQEKSIPLSPELSGVLHPNGIYLNGLVLAQKSWERPTKEKESCLLPTPMGHARAKTSYSAPGQDRLEKKLRELGVVVEGQISSPEFREWMQGLPTGWTNITEADGGETTLLQNESASEAEVFPIEASECKQLETAVLQPKDRSAGEESQRLQRSLESNISQVAKTTIDTPQIQPVIELDRLPVTQSQLIEFEAWCADISLRYQELSKLYQRTDKDSDNWYTPPEILDLVIQVMGGIDLDPCSNPQKSVPATVHYTFEEDGLEQPWCGRVFMNPPYSSPGLWMQKLEHEYYEGLACEAIALVPAATDTKWLSPIMERGDTPICFWKGRIKFLDKDLKKQMSARQSHCLVYFGENQQKFKEVFAPYGTIFGGNYGKMVEMLPSASDQTSAGAENYYQESAMGADARDRAGLITRQTTHSTDEISKEACPISLGNNSKDNSTIDSTDYAVVNLESSIALGELPEYLTPDEERHLHHLERKVEQVIQSIVEGGKALAEIRDRRLYRASHKTFEEYCKDRFGYTRRNVNYAIAAAAVIENLGKNLSQATATQNLGKNLSQTEPYLALSAKVLPTKPEQVRFLTQLEPEEQVEVWEKAVEESGGKIPSGRVVKGIVEKLKEKPQHLASEYASVGDIFILQRLSGDEARYNRCWAIAVEVDNRFTVQCRALNQKLEIKQENMKRLDLTTQQAEKQRQVIERVSRLASLDLPHSFWKMLEGLNQQISYTDEEMKMLDFVEQLYGISDRPN